MDATEIVAHQDDLSNSEIIHWYKVNGCAASREGALGYNQRAEDSENRIEELKLDFGGDTLPCSDFAANALYFLIPRGRCKTKLTIETPAQPCFESLWV